jgi:hypothetical protein
MTLSKPFRRTVLLVAMGVALLLPSGVAHASHVNDWSVQIYEDETFECAFAKAARQRVIKSRAPKILLKELAADVEKRCAKASQDLDSTDEGGESPERTVVSPNLLPAGWRTQQLALLNATRAKKGLRPMKECANLDRAAQKYAREMAKTQVYAHRGPSGSSPQSRMRKQGYQGRIFAENIHRGRFTVATAFEAWVRSTGHYRNLIYPGLTHVGFGASESKDGDIYWVQNFGAGGSCRS